MPTDASTAADQRASFGPRPDRSRAVAVSASGLVKSYGEVRALVGVDLEVRRGHRAGPARAERRRQDDDRPDPDDAAEARRRHRARRGPRRRRRCGGAARADRARRPVRGRRRKPDRAGEPDDGRPPVRQTPRPRPRSRATSCSSASTCSTRPADPTKTYSGGMRRRLDLAAALVAKPPVLFLDEPTTGLDPRSRLQLWEMIERLVADGTTVLLTTQYLDEADRLGDAIAVIDHGEVIADGHARRAEGPGRRRAARDTAGRGVPRGRCGAGARSDGGRAAGDRRASWCSSASAGAAARSSRPCARLDEAGVGVEDIALRRPTLDDVFLALTGHAAEKRSRRTMRTRRRESARDGHAGDRRAQPRAAAARSRAAARVHRPADHVRAAVPLRVRRRDQDARLQLRRLPDPRDHRPEHRLRRIRHRARSQRGSAQGADRPLPLAADGARRGARGQDARGHGDQRAVGHDPGHHRTDHRVLVSHELARRARGRRPAAAVRLRVLLGVRVPRDAGLDRRGSELGRVHRRVPADVHLLGVRARAVDAAGAAGVRGSQSVHDTSSTRCARSGSGLQRETTSGAPSCGRS